MKLASGYSDCAGSKYKDLRLQVLYDSCAISFLGAPPRLPEGTLEPGHRTVWTLIAHLEHHISSELEPRFGLWTASGLCAQAPSDALSMNASTRTRTWEGNSNLAGCWRPLLPTKGTVPTGICGSGLRVLAVGVSALSSTVRMHLPLHL